MPTNEVSTAESPVATTPLIIEIEGTEKNVPLDSIQPFMGQPRKWFHPGKLRELADGIKEVGQRISVQVIKLPVPKGNILYELIDGERRWRAMEFLGRKKIRIIEVQVADEQEQYVYSVVANNNREGHTVLETAHACKRFKGWGKTHEQIGILFGGKSASWVTQHLKILELDPGALEFIDPSLPEERQITFSTLQLLGNVPREYQVDTARAISVMGLSITQARVFIDTSLAAKGHRRTNVKPVHEFEIMARVFSRAAAAFELENSKPEDDRRLALKDRKPWQLEMVIDDITKAEEALKTMKAFLQKVKAEKEAKS